MSLNQLFLDTLGKVSLIMTRLGEAFRAKAYQKAQDTIQSVSLTTVLTKENYVFELKDKPGIGTGILEKLNEIVETGTLSLIEREKNNPMNIFCDIYGVGPKKAKEIVDAGIKTIAQLRASTIHLNDNQRVGLLYYDDILLRIEREEIDQFNMMLKSLVRQIKVEFTPTTIIDFEIVGSYRRGAKDSGDIDVILTSTNSAVFSRFITVLQKAGIILEILSQGNHKCLVVGRIALRARRIDFLFTTPDEYPFSILYFTGSKLFNTVMRGHALTLGYSMNEHGLTFKSGKEVVDVLFKTERDIFHFLQLEYKEPWERIDSRAVVSLSLSSSLPSSALPSSSTSSSILSSYRTKGLTTLTKKELEELLAFLNHAYFNQSTSFVTDSEFDTIKEYYEKTFGIKKKSSSAAVAVVGAPEEKGLKVTLPYFMASMDKIKPDTSSLSNWCSKYKGPYILSCKLDGVSGLLVSRQGETQVKLYTRGDGIIGQDISHLIPHLRGLPMTFLQEKEREVAIRGEFLISKANFVSKYKNEFANARNMVAGAINHKHVHSSIMKDVDFVAYEVISPVLTPSEQLQYLKTNQFRCVPYMTTMALTNDSLSHLLLEWREKQPYEIDGIIVANDKVYPRSSVLQNPEWAFAFKMVLTDQVAEAQVVEVIWTPSKDGYLKPRVRILPIFLGGVMIEYATGFNAAFIHDHKIGVGAIIEIIRSGDVIPHISAVKVPAAAPMMPPEDTVSYKWNDTHVDIVLQDLDSNEMVREKNITGFFKGVGVDGLGSGNVRRIMDAGFKTVAQILNMSVADFLKVEGFQMTMAQKIYQGIHTKLADVSLLTLMSCSNIFGRGFSEKKMELILAAYPDILLSNESSNLKVKKLAEIKGLASKTAEAFVERIPHFLAFLEECHLSKKMDVQVPMSTSLGTASTSGAYTDKTFVTSGFRDKELETKLKSIGAKIGSNVTKNTHMLIVKDITDNTQKIIDAKKYGIPIVLLENLVL